MAIEDLTIEIGTTVTGEDDIDSLIGSLESLDAAESDVDPVSIDVEVEDDAQAIADIASITTAAEAADQTITIDTDIDDDALDALTLPDDENVTLGVETEVTGADEVITELTTIAGLVKTLDESSINLDVDIEEVADKLGIETPDGGVDLGNVTPDGGTDGGTADGGAVPDGDDSVDERFQPMNVDQLIELREALGERFDPRGMVREDITLEELRSGMMEESPFTIPSEMDADRLFGRDRDIEGIEEFFDWNEVFEQMEAEGVESLLNMGENIGDKTFLRTDDHNRFTTFPADEEPRNTPNSLQDLLDRETMATWVFGQRDPFTGKRQGVLNKFGSLHMEKVWDAFAKLLPVLLVFVGALPAAITGIVALGAAALGAAAGLAALGGLTVLSGAFMMGDGNIAKGLQELRTVIKDQFLTAFVPLFGSFDDLFRDAISGLGDFFDALAARGDVLTQLKDDARALGGLVIDFVPSALAMLVRMGEAFMPIFAMFGEWASMNFDNFLRGLVNVFNRILPFALMMIDAFLRMLPVIIDLSMGFFFASSIIIQFISSLLQLFNVLGPLGTFLATIIGLLVAFASITAMLHGLWTVLSALLGGTVVARLASFVAAQWAAFAANNAFAASALKAAASAAILLGVLTFGIIPALSALGGAFGFLSSDIDKATKSLDQFSSVRSGMGLESGSYGGLSPGSVSVYNDNSKNVYNGSDEDSQRRMARKNNFRQNMFAPY